MVAPRKKKRTTPIKTELCFSSDESPLPGSASEYENSNVISKPPRLEGIHHLHMLRKSVNNIGTNLFRLQLPLF